MSKFNADKAVGSVMVTAGCLWLLWVIAIITGVILGVAALAKYVFS